MERRRGGGDHSGLSSGQHGWRGRRHNGGSLRGYRSGQGRWISGWCSRLARRLRRGHAGWLRIEELHIGGARTIPGAANVQAVGLAGLVLGHGVGELRVVSTEVVALRNLRVAEEQAEVRISGGRSTATARTELQLLQRACLETGGLVDTQGIITIANHVRLEWKQIGIQHSVVHVDGACLRLVAANVQAELLTESVVLHYVEELGENATKVVTHRHLKVSILIIETNHRIARVVAQATAGGKLQLLIRASSDAGDRFVLLGVVGVRHLRRLHGELVVGRHGRQHGGIVIIQR